MVYASTSNISRSIGPGAGGVTDKILNGADSRRGGSLASHIPPSLQDVVFRSLIQHNVRITLVDNSEAYGKLLWYNSGKFGLIPHGSGSKQVIMSCNRVLRVTPLDVEQDSCQFITESIQSSLLFFEEKSSKLQIVKRRLQERDKRVNRMAQFAKQNNRLPTQLNS